MRKVSINVADLIKLSAVCTEEEAQAVNMFFKKCKIITKTDVSLKDRSSMLIEDNTPERPHPTEPTRKGLKLASFLNWC